MKDRSELLALLLPLAALTWVLVHGGQLSGVPEPDDPTLAGEPTADREQALALLHVHVGAEVRQDARREVRLGGVARRVGVVLLGIPLLLGDPIFPPHKPTNVPTPGNIVYG